MISISDISTNTETLTATYAGDTTFLTKRRNPTPPLLY